MFVVVNTAVVSIKDYYRTQVKFGEKLQTITKELATTEKAVIIQSKVKHIDLSKWCRAAEKANSGWKCPEAGTEFEFHEIQEQPEEN